MKVRLIIEDCYQRAEMIRILQENGYNADFGICPDRLPNNVYIELDAYEVAGIESKKIEAFDRIFKAFHDEIDVGNFLHKCAGIISEYQFELAKIEED